MKILKKSLSCFAEKVNKQDITEKQLKRIDELGINKIAMCRYYNIPAINKMPESLAAKAIEEKEKQLAKKTTAEILDDSLPE